MVNRIASLEQGKHMMLLFKNLDRLCLIALYLCLPYLLNGCGGSQIDMESARISCKKGVNVLQKRVGPEFSKLISITPLPITSSKFGCVLVYTKVLEELPGEVVGKYVSSVQPHELAFIIPDVEGRLVLTQPSFPKHRRGGVEMEVKLAEVHNGGIPEVLVEEKEIGSRDDIYALRIFLYAEGVPAPKEIFSERVSYKTSAGVEVPAEWLVGVVEGLPAIFLKPKYRKKERVYMWHESLQTYQFDLAVTQRRALSATASQNALSKKDIKRRPVTKVTKSAVPKSLVKVINKDSAPSKSPVQPQEAESDYDFSSDESAQPEPAATPSSESSKKEDKVTTVNEFLEGL